MAKLKWHETGEKFYETGIKDVVLYVYDETRDEYIANTDPTYVANKFYSRSGTAGSYTYDLLTSSDAPEGWSTNYTTYFVENPTEYGKGVAWNGVTSLSETPSGGEASDLYADDDKYLSLYSEEQLGASIEAYTYPDEWGVCDGSAFAGSSGDGQALELKQQKRMMFALAYITTVGDDVVGNDRGEKLHLLYGCKASPSDRSYSTINDSPEAITFSWELTTTKQEVPEGFKKTCLITIDTTKLTPASQSTDGRTNTTYVALKGMIQGTDSTDPYIPKAKDVIEMFMSNG